MLTRSSAQYYLDPLRLTHYVHAVRYISAGEELTIACTCISQSEMSVLTRIKILLLWSSYQIVRGILRSHFASHADVLVVLLAKPLTRPWPK